MNEAPSYKARQLRGNAFKHQLDPEYPQHGEFATGTALAVRLD